MPVRGHENGEAGESSRAVTNSHAANAVHGPTHDSWVGCYPQKLIEYSPGRVPGYDALVYAVLENEHLCGGRSRAGSEW